MLVAALALYFHQNIQPVLVSEINKSLAVKVEVQQISLSSLRDFPNLGIKMSDVSIAESTPYYKEKLLVAEELNLFVDIWKLYKGEYVIDKIIIRDAALRVADLNYGTNYDILKPSEEDAATPVSFEISKLIMINCDIRYEHRPSKLLCNTYTPSSTLSLKYTGNDIILGVNAQLNASHLRSGKDDYLTKKNLKINANLEVLTDEERLVVYPSDMLIEKVNLSVDGEVNYSAASAIDLRFSNDRAPLADILSMLPRSATESLDHLQLSGDATINAYLRGKTYARNEPSFGLDYLLKEGTVTIAEQSLTLSHISAEGKLRMPTLSNMKEAEASAIIQNAATGNNAISGTLAVKDFEIPTITWDGQAKLDASFIFGLLGDANFEPSSGQITANGKLRLQYNTYTQELAKDAFSYIGEIAVKNLKGKLTNPALNVKDFSLNLTANKRNVQIKNATFAYNQTSGKFNGDVLNFKSLLNPQSNLKLTGNLTVNNLYINELYATSDTSEKQNGTSTDDLLPINLAVQTTFNNFQYNDFIAQKMSGTLLSDRKSISLPNCKIIALQGNTIANVSLKKWGASHLLDIHSDIANINITELFKQFNNFEQSEITYENLSGTLSGKIIAKIILDENYEPILPKLYVKADVVVSDGALVAYEPLMELSTFAKVDDLKNVKFKTLQNTIEIFDQTIFIPKMKIRNNALNLQIEGTHTFENYMTYNMELSIAELLATKANWIARKAEKRIEKNQEGGLTAYITMEGTPDDLKIRYDKATVKENVKEEVKNEKKKFIKALKGEATLDQKKADTKDYDNVWDEE